MSGPPRAELDTAEAECNPIPLTAVPANDPERPEAPECVRAWPCVACACDCAIECEWEWEPWRAWVELGVPTPLPAYPAPVFVANLALAHMLGDDGNALGPRTLELGRTFAPWG